MRKFIAVFIPILFISVTLFISTSSAQNTSETEDCKPPSVGPVIVSDRQILLNPDSGPVPYYVNGMGYAPAPIGTFPGNPAWCRQNPNPPPAWDCTYELYKDIPLLSRDFLLGPKPNLASSKANTIRTWGGDVTLLAFAADLTKKKVLAGFWLNHDTDYTNAQERAQAKSAFRAFVRQSMTSVKYPDGFLGWGLTNENNIGICSCCNPPSVTKCCNAQQQCNRQAQTAGLYSLLDEMAYEAYLEEGENYLPVVVVHAGLGDIGDATVGADDANMCNVDIHGVNDYSGVAFAYFNHPSLKHTGSVFEKYETLSGKPMIITEAGTDVILMTDPNSTPNDPYEGVEDEDVQAKFIGHMLDTVNHYSVYNTGNHSGRVNSGVFIFQYTDIYWRADQVWNLQKVSTHDLDYSIINGWPWAGGQPDGYVNEEWFGMFKIKRHPKWTVKNQLPDLIFERKANKTLNQKW